MPPNSRFIASVYQVKILCYSQLFCEQFTNEIMKNYIAFSDVQRKKVVNISLFTYLPRVIFLFITMATLITFMLGYYRNFWDQYLKGLMTILEVDSPNS